MARSTRPQPARCVRARTRTTGSTFPAEGALTRKGEAIRVRKLLLTAVVLVVAKCGGGGAAVDTPTTLPTASTTFAAAAVGTSTTVPAASTTSIAATALWSQADAPAVLGGPADQYVTGVVAGGPGLVAVGSDGSGGDSDAAVWISPPPG